MSANTIAARQFVEGIGGRLSASKSATYGRGVLAIEQRDFESVAAVEPAQGMIARGDVGRIDLAAHHEPDCGLGVARAQRIAGEQAVDRLGDHAALPMARKLRAITSPRGVSTDSGWN